MLSMPVGMSVGLWFLYRRATAPKVSSLWKDQRRTSYIASTTTAVFRFCCGRLRTALTPVSSLRTLTGLAFVPAALIVPSSLKSEGWVLLHSIFPMKFTIYMPTSPPLATICVIRRRAATALLFKGPAG